MPSPYAQDVSLSPPIGDSEDTSKKAADFSREAAVPLSSRLARLADLAKPIFVGEAAWWPWLDFSGVFSSWKRCGRARMTSAMG